MKKILVILIITMFLTGSVYAKEKVVVGSKIDTEGSLLGNMILLMLEENNIPTVNKIELGPTNIVRNAIKTGQIDIYPEYTGNGAFFFDNFEKGVLKDFQKGYETVKKLDYEHNKIVWLTPANANNTWAIATRRDVAEKHSLKSLEDFAKYVNNGGYVKLACSEEFATREDALPAFMEAYNFKLQDKNLLILSGGNTAQTAKAAAQKTSGVNFAMVYGTDGALAALNLVVLEDTKNVQPVYAPAPIIREEVLNKYPEIKKILKPVFESLNMEKLQKMNSEIAIGGIPAETVAKNYLKANGFIH
jgi:osmoprotectant transport system substrate-binding protein